MNIQELERITGITRQNIRFYEKKGLVHPPRNAANNYREYTQENVRTLQIIKALRRLDLSIDDIHKILSEELSWQQAVSCHLQKLLEKKGSLQSCISICKELRHMELQTVDTEELLRKIDQAEQKGGFFMSILNDYKQIEKEESLKSFTFMPDTMVMNAREFTDALLQYADANNIPLLITKEGMYPVFEINGVEYTAHRTFGRFGAVVHCSLSHPETVEDNAIPQSRRKFYKFLIRNALLLFLVIFMIASRLSTGQSIWLSLLTAVCLAFPLAWIFRLK